MERLRVSGEEIPFEPALVPADDGDGFERQRACSSRASTATDRQRVSSSTGRTPAASVVTDLSAGRVGLQLMKVTGSAFADFARDEYTTLPERRDRPLYIHLDVGWRYASPDFGARRPTTRATSPASRSPTSSAPSSTAS